MACFEGGGDATLGTCVYLLSVVITLEFFSSSRPAGWWRVKELMTWGIREVSRNGVLMAWYDAWE